MADVKPVIHVYCPAGFSYVELNRLKVYLNHNDITRAVVDLVYAVYEEVPEEGIPPYAKLVTAAHNQLDREIEAGPGESFSLWDWAVPLEEIFNYDVVCHDGEPYPEKP